MSEWLIVGLVITAMVAVVAFGLSVVVVYG